VETKKKGKWEEKLRRLPTRPVVAGGRAGNGGKKKETRVRRKAGRASFIPPRNELSRWIRRTARIELPF
jgi:hypothetical protein